MRRMTIKRNKAFPGCFGKVQVYIRDLEHSTITINYTPCRQLGELKNGEEKTFEIPEDEVRVFVCAGKLLKDDYTADSRTIKAGPEGVRLSGCCTSDPQNGNPFKFDK